MQEELNDIWDTAPKFPDVETAEVRIDVDSFVQIYRDVDDLFEEDEEKTSVELNSPQDRIAVESDATLNESNEEEDEETLEAELETIYSSICDKNGLISRESLKSWDEVQKLLSEGLLGDDEFNDIWERTPKSPGSNEELDVDGFLSFNVALDGLFDFDNDDEDSIEDAEDGEEVRRAEGSKDKGASARKASKEGKKQMVEGAGLPPGILFAALADDDYLVGLEELKYWVELQDMLSVGDLLPLELQNIYEGLEKVSGKLNEEGFIKLWEEIESLFEDVAEDDQETFSAANSPRASPSNSVKEDLLDVLEVVNDNEGGLPCGLDCTEAQQRQVLNIVGALEKQPSNLILQRKGNILMKDLAGTWELLYSSSSAMKFNKGLSGLGGSFPNGRFAGLKQILKASKYMSDLEYIERIEVNPSSASFDVTVTGDWDIRTSVSLFTGEPSIVLSIEPGRVNYGPTSTRADHWKSLGPMNMLDLTYLDSDLRVMRGCTSADTLFIFKRVS